MSNQTYHRQHGERLIRESKKEYNLQIELLKQEGKLSPQYLDFLARLEERVHHYKWFVEPVKLGGDISLSNEYPRVEISSPELGQVVEIIDRENLILYPTTTDNYFSLAFSVLHGEKGVLR